MTAPIKPAPFHDLIGIALQAAVPIHILTLGRLSDQQRDETFQAERPQLVDAIVSRGDVLQFGSKKSGAAADVFNKLARALARALAFMAFTPGGVPFAGLVWCAAHSPGGRAGAWPCETCTAEEVA